MKINYKYISYAVIVISIAVILGVVLYTKKYTKDVDSSRITLTKTPDPVILQNKGEWKHYSQVLASKNIIEFDYPDDALKPNYIKNADYDYPGPRGFGDIHVEEVNLENISNPNDAVVFITQFTSDGSVSLDAVKFLKEGHYEKSNWHLGNSTVVIRSNSQDKIDQLNLALILKDRLIKINIFNFSDEAQNRFLSSLVINGEQATTTPLADNLVWNWPEARKK